MPIDVSIVLPCLDERLAVGHIVERSFAALDELGVTGEVVVCDNGSVDGSGEVAKAAGARVVRQSVRGYGIAVRTGIAAAAGNVVAVMDSDGSYCPDDLVDLVRPILDGDAEYVRGSRFTRGPSPGAMTFARRRIGNPALTALLRLAGGTPWSDGQSGMWAVTAAAYRRLDLRADGMEFAHEIILVMHRSGARPAEVPIAYLPRCGRSKLRPVRDGLRHLRLLGEYALLGRGVESSRRRVVPSDRSDATPPGRGRGSRGRAELGR